MNTVHVTTSHPYQVLVGPNLLSQLGDHLRDLCGNCHAAIISDSNVWPLYGEACLRSLQAAGFDNTVHYVFPAGESSKNIATYGQGLEFLAAHRLTRSDCIIALGGGVVGDLAGFIAATYLRGISYIQVPTTLLAAVDSSVGGKTAVDLAVGKNLAGAFYQPKLVLCDTGTLSTLPPEIFRDGCAEVIKYGVLFDRELFTHLMTHGPTFDRQWVISRCVQWKAEVVIRDELDRGERQKLNLGHTIGHGVEAGSQYAISHGSAVAIGMAIIARAAKARGLSACSEDITSVLTRFGLPVTTDLSAQTLYENALSDKKRTGDTLHLVIPRHIGLCTLESFPVNELLSFIKAGHSTWI